MAPGDGFNDRFLFVPRSEQGKIRSKFDLGILDFQIAMPLIFEGVLL